ncbi:unnamed protein product, partial [Didymodactylos carnosus]
MSRNTRKNIGPKDEQQPKDGQKRISAVGSSTSGAVAYDELFPPLLPASSTSSVSDRAPHPVENRQPSTSVGYEQQKAEVISGEILLTQCNSNAQPEVRSKSNLEESVENKLCEIILSIHLRHKFVSVQDVERELFDYFGVQSFRELGVDQRNLNPLKNLIHYNKDVTFYMQIFEQLFNLCTLHDLGPLLAKFLKVDNYEDASLGPLDKHPDVKRVFKYKSSKQQPIPAITSGDIINAFLEFQDKNKGRRCFYEEFLDELVKQNQLQKREELGIYCKSFPYLTEVTRKIARDHTQHKRQADLDVRQQMMNVFQTRLSEMKQEMDNELELLSYTKKSPIAVFNHLCSVVEKHLTVPEQKTVRAILVKIGNDSLLQCLLNLSIYLGTIDKPDRFITELQKLYQSQTANSGGENIMMPSQLSGFNQPNRKREHNPQSSMVSGGVSRTTIETSFENSSIWSHPNESQPSAKQLCSDLVKLLKRYDTVLSIKQLFDVEKCLCDQHSVKTFSEFGVNDDDDCDSILDLISFLYKFREKIDPNGELSIYENPSSIGDRQEMYSFVSQLIVLNDRREEQQHDEHSSNREIHMTKDQLSAVEQAVKHKFGGLLGFNRSSQVINKAKQQQQHRKMDPIIHFEESMLDVVGLNRLGICPSSLLIDEAQLCQIILQCPIMSDLFTWLQWTHFFQPRYGSLKKFIARKDYELDRLLLLETSNHELLRLPSDSSLENFEKELEKKNICSAIGHLCALITCEYVQVNRLPLTIYRQVMTTWFLRLRTSAQLQPESIEPMQYVLEFLTYLPELIGQTRIVQELVLELLDNVFDNDKENRVMNARQTIWKLANAKQKCKLEMWGYTLDIDEWKNVNKWKGIKELQEESTVQQVEKDSHKKEVMRQVEATLALVSPSTTTTSNPSTSMDNPIMDDNDPSRVAFEHIKKIREGFGVDSSLDAAGQSIVTNLQGMIERSLEKLSNDLYSEQGHFVLELIQNADDNQYAFDRLPTLRFILTSDRILVCNNEIGFQSNHISAICNV